MRLLSLSLVAFVWSMSTAAAENTFVVRPSFQDVPLTAFTRPRAVVRLIAEEKGRFNSVDVDVGDTIGEAQRFGCLDTVYVDLSIEANRARQKRLRRADLDYFTRQVKRFRNLVERSTTAQSSLDDLERQRVGTRAGLTEAEVEARKLKERKRRHCIEASKGWQVTERRVDPGQWVNAGDPLGRVADFSVLLAPFALSYPEYQVLIAYTGPLSVRLVDEGIDVEATPIHLNPDFDEATRKISVDLALDKGVPNKRGGLRVKLVLRLPDASGAVLVPVAAVQERYEQHWVTGTDKVERAVVYLGEIEQDGQRWARVVSPQLKAGDRVIVP
ncbi:hypothetical protein MNBD_GAMMA15-1271 [hydrothermal vent metagenome]|uniref:RND efflux pump membrane fusion protein barrel-sandwich domain-containing protein n=1 Tax=hydrothermal vent metagenome TaxID=652676 RepID=A0A3B0YZY5_9ZZZZ